MSAQKFECISMETNSETKEFLSMAAFLSGHKDLSSFILDTMQKEAQKIFEDEHKLVLSNCDRDLVLDLIVQKTLFKQDIDLKMNRCYYWHYVQQGKRS